MCELETQVLNLKVDKLEVRLNAVRKKLTDSPLQLLCATRLQIEKAKRNPRNFAGSLNRVDELILQTIDELRSITKFQCDNCLDSFSLIENLNIKFERNNQNCDVNFHFDHPKTISLSSELQILIFPIIEDVIKQSIQFSDVSNVYISMIEPVTNLTVTIVNDATEPTTEEVQKCNKNIDGIAEKLNGLNGTIKWNITKTGTEFDIQLNYKKQEV